VPPPAGPPPPVPPPAGPPRPVRNVTPPPRPLAPDRYRYQLTIDGETRDLLAQAKDLLRHAGGAAEDGSVLKRALTLLVADLRRRKFAETRRPRATEPAGPAATSRHISAAVKRAVVARDQGCCAYVAPGGRRCTERAFLEFHHLKPFAVGGVASTANIALRCRSHNGYEAKVYFDRGEEATRSRPSPSP
jgi:hypothetical protein